jgi:hypothetical protein
MTIHNVFKAAHYVTRTTQMAKRKGISLEVGDDFQEYARIVKKYRTEQPLGVPWDTRFNFLKGPNSFWIVGRDREGEVVHTQAMRKLDLAGLTLAEYLEERFLDFPPPGITLDMDASTYRAGPAARGIKGKVCYHGDVWLKGGPNGFRGTGVSSLLARVAMATCMLRWEPDHLFAFMPQQIAFKGLTEREGYMHAEPGSLSWKHANVNESMEAFMVWMAHSDLQYLLQIPLEPLVK